MEHEKLATFSDQELLAEAKRLKTFSITNAVLIGLLLGIVVFSVFQQTFGFLMLIPLFFIYKLIRQPKNKRYKAVQTALRQRNLNQHP